MHIHLEKKYSTVVKMLHYHIKMLHVCCEFIALKNVIWIGVTTAGICCLIFTVCRNRSTCYLATKNTHRDNWAATDCAQHRCHSWIHSTRHYAYKLSIHIKHLDTMSTQVACNLIWAHMYSRVSVSQAER